MGKSLSATARLIVPKVKLCQLTVHSRKLEKSALKHQRFRLKRRLLQAQKPEADATTRNGLSCSGNLDKTGCSFLTTKILE
jgi:hypothetical protein